ncbi:MAG: hypothetical protein QOJ65_1075 [Fimbriimonadaceae bacterium]|nr:hypothetical protein [Fimbriimonadaceae bacterium]
MTNLSLRCVCVAGLFGASLLATAQNNKWKFDYIAIEAGAYFPTSGLVRDRFGSTIGRIGISPIMVRRTPDWRPSFELGYMGAKGKGDRFAVFPFTIGVQKSFGDPDGQTAPFVRAGVGLAYFDYDIAKGTDPVATAGRATGPIVKGKKLGAVTSFEAGIMSGDRFRASVRYYLMPKQSGIDFSGVLLSASWGVFRM